MFSCKEWAETFGAELAKDGDGSGAGLGYDDHWLNAFETLLSRKGIAAAGQLQGLRDAWDQARSEGQRVGNAFCRNFLSSAPPIYITTNIHNQICAAQERYY